MIEKKAGDYLRFVTTFQYRGPATSSVRMRCVIGKRGSVSFDENQFVDNAMSLTRCTEWTTFNLTQIIQSIYTQLANDETYDVYVKIYKGLAIYTEWEMHDALKIVSVAAESDFQNLSVAIS